MHIIHQLIVRFHPIHLAAQIPAEIERRREDVSPAVILIPGREGSLGIGTAGVHAAAEKAVGADIL